MGLLKKKQDPISERSKALNQKISELEAEIKQLSKKVEPRPLERQPAPPPPVKKPADPIFERIEPKQPRESADPGTTPHLYNDLGVRKYDLVGAWHSLLNHFRSPPAQNPRLVSYLAAGSIKGLRPLRYEKRVARNRFLFLFLFFVLVLWGMIAVMFNSR
ncbi:MAG: hypothetical protein SFY81_06955 [Verrucomicrobiota bacterium]|nr:hypothetical protein [Verrucomicrobiota bacterium]